jgi:hypothetical protein
VDGFDKHAGYYIGLKQKNNNKANNNLARIIACPHSKVNVRCTSLSWIYSPPQVGGQAAPGELFREKNQFETILFIGYQGKHIPFLDAETQGLWAAKEENYVVVNVQIE